MVNGQNIKIILLLFVLMGGVGMDVYPAEESDTGDSKKPALWSNEVTFSEESIVDYLPEEEDSDRISAKRFNSDYSTNKSNAVPVSVGVT